MRILKTSADFHSVGTDIRISELKDYLELLVKQLEIIAKDYNEHIKEVADKITNEREREEFYEDSGETYWDYRKTYPRILLNSFLVAAYSLLESEICSLASRIGRKKKQVFDITDFGSRDYLGIASKYIYKLTGIKVQDFKSWNSIDDGRQIRNIIVHSNGKITKQHDFDLSKRYKFLDDSTLDFPSIRPTTRLSITYEYCHSFLVSMGEFFSDFYTEVGKFL
jgi:hypothetical protein